MQIFDHDHQRLRRARSRAPIRPASPASAAAVVRAASVDGGYSAGSGRFSSGASSGIASAGFSPAAVSRGSSCAICSRGDASPTNLPQHFGDRIEGRVLEKGAGARFDPGMRRTRDLFMEALHQARFADARFADDQ